ncbi:MAG: hypothetical protein J7L11_09770 [Thermoprotei archaeon]|nr:hypothetical protein [Thermoprotei archaeon]
MKLCSVYSAKLKHEGSTLALGLTSELAMSEVRSLLLELGISSSPCDFKGILRLLAEDLTFQDNMPRYIKLSRDVISPEAPLEALTDIIDENYGYAVAYIHDDSSEQDVALLLSSDVVLIPVRLESASMLHSRKLISLLTRFRVAVLPVLFSPFYYEEIRDLMSTISQILGKEVPCVLPIDGEVSSAYVSEVIHQGLLKPLLRRMNEL